MLEILPLFCIFWLSCKKKNFSLNKGLKAFSMGFYVHAPACLMSYVMTVAQCADNNSYSMESRDSIATSMWTRTGVTDLDHLWERVEKTFQELPGQLCLGEWTLPWALIQVRHNDEVSKLWLASLLVTLEKKLWPWRNVKEPPPFSCVVLNAVFVLWWWPAQDVFSTFTLCVHQPYSLV